MYKKKVQKIIVGIDEVGRGPLAGPVSVCVLKMLAGNYGRFLKSLERKFLRDSKKLSEKKRQTWFSKIRRWQKEELLDFSYQTVSAREIDRIGISSAIAKALNAGLRELRIPSSAAILLDGSLFAPKRFKKQKTIIRGDEKEPIISLASIVAKVRRDDFMVRLAKKSPKKYRQYDFKNNKGYGTLAHRRAIRKLGLSSIHRKSFCKGIISV
ncbi:MAG TPA: ribonuclease HII [Candidatus Paceibacterota bacterium]|nr:ribonuclease HII [Candidatus Paceibacterota bacterium]HRZ34497.1 ribonuclease HII [Candidatus Paceibacterota bacterium]